MATQPPGVPAPRKGKSLPPTLLTPPIPQQNPIPRRPTDTMSKRMSYFDISAVPSQSGPSSTKSKPSTPLNDTETPMEGLGINFNDHGNETDGGARDSEDSDEARNLANQAQPQSHDEQQPGLQTPTSNNNNDDIDFTKAPGEGSLDLIEQLLEDNYRGQAETFVRKSSQASIRSLSQPSSRSSSLSSSVHRKNRINNLEYTPTRNPSRDIEADLLETQRGLRTPGSRTPNGANRVIVEPYQIHSGGRRNTRSGFTPDSASPHSTYGHRIFSVPRPPNDNSLSIPKQNERHSATKNRVLQDPGSRDPFFFTDQERQAIAKLVHANSRECDRHPDCTDCHNIEYAYFENKAIPTTMPPEDRQKIINNNRSLRNIKNELENLLESGAISDSAYDAMMQALPSESSLNGPAPTRSAATSPTPAPVASFSNLTVNDHPPPAYNTPTPPSLPGRTPTKPEISRATALYRYAEAGDCNFEVGDQISVFEHMNADWWLGKNLRTGQEGVFPVNYVQVQTNPSRNGGMSPAPPQGYYGNEKTQAYGGYQPQQQGPPPPGPSNPYNSAVPPMQIAEQPTESKPGKGQEMGKKFGKKLGNAAIFGAGATIGGNIVNSIF